MSVASTLIIRPSSLGDIVHALPIVHDLAQHRSGMAIDWVAEEPFAGLVALNRGVRRVMPVALRRWRHHLLRQTTWREFAVFRRQLVSEHYDVVLDLQEQVKGALLGMLSRGPVHGPDRASIREPAATLFYRHTHRIDPDAHLIDRCRALAGAAFGYKPEGPPHFDLSPPHAQNAPSTRYAVLLHATSRADKLWPEAHWRVLIEHFLRAGIVVVLPWGTAAESARSARLADGLGGVVVPPHRSLPRLAALLARADIVFGVDTGLVHLAAALGVPTIALFVATDARLAGVERASARARDLGGIGIVPSPEEAIVAAAALLRGAPGC
ncbi:MAG: lipopolysaccharide heptosyltransferase I [Casimicrobiaceae bacterium]